MDRNHRQRTILAAIGTWLVATSASPAVAMQDDAGQEPRVLDSHEVEIEDLGISLVFPESLTDLRGLDEDSEQVRGAWIGRLGAAKVDIRVFVLAKESFGFGEPDDIVEMIADRIRDGRFGTELPRFAWADQQRVHGPFGYVRYACMCRGELPASQGTADAATLFALGVLQEQHGLCIELICSPAATVEQTKALSEFLETGVTCSGKERNHLWEEDEAEARWNEHAPESARGDKFKEPLRTKHYVVLTNSSGGGSFAKKMEECYDKIKKVYPFEEVAGRKLMPVFLFRTNEQYYEYCVSVAGWTVGEAKKSKGHSWKDYYATWYESPNDPVHIHEATHQIFGNRLFLNGGGSWFQEGVAEYICTQKNERNNAARLVAKGEATPLKEFMQLKSLLHSSGTDPRFGSLVHEHYHMAALLVEFLRESKWGKDKFQDWTHAIGRVPRRDLEGIERETKRVYGVTIEELEQKWREYCKAR